MFCAIKHRKWFSVRWTINGSQPTSQPKANLFRFLLRLYGKWWRRRHTDNTFVHLFSVRHSLVARPPHDIAMHIDGEFSILIFVVVRVFASSFDFLFRSFPFDYVYRTHSLRALTCLVAWHICIFNWFDWTAFTNGLWKCARRTSRPISMNKSSVLHALFLFRLQQTMSSVE